MLNAECSLADEIRVLEVKKGGVTFESIAFGELIRPEIRRDLEGVLRSDSNLIFKAAELFARNFGVETGLNLSFIKNIPAGAGLGGGSSNAGTILRFLLNHYHRELSDKYSPVDLQAEILKIAVKLGADVPFSLFGGAALVSGIGEVIKPVPGKMASFLDGCEVFLIAPQSPSSTVLAYKAFAESNPWLKTEVRADSLIGDLTNSESAQDFYQLMNKLTENDFQALVSSRIPEVGRIIDLLNDLKIGRVVLSGSGSAILLLPFPKGKFSWEERSVIRSVLTHNSIKYFDGFIELV